MKPVIAHVITGLGIGGAERFLHRFMRARGDRFDHAVLSMTGRGPLGPPIEQAGVPLHCLDLRGPTQFPAAVTRTREWLRQQRAVLVQSWMYKADLLATFATRGSGLPVIWNVRQTNIRYRFNSWDTLATIRLLKGIARGSLPLRPPQRIVYCAAASRKVHQAYGYRDGLGVVIPNGIDADEFFPDLAARRLLRRQLGIAEEVPVVGMVGRHDPQKGHARFLACAERIRRRVPDAVFLLAGRGIDPDNARLAALLARHGLGDAVRLLGQRRDIRELMNVFDVYLSSSDGEGWPNVVAEAMACAVPCVATDVGDTAALLGPNGRVHAVDDLDGLGASVVELLSAPDLVRADAGAAHRRRIVDHFLVADSIRKYESLYAEVLGSTSCVE